ncbi:MAG: hypothetical protein AAGH72_06085 [Verrucomicrobiota bacterium]
MLKENTIRFAAAKEDYWYARMFSGSNQMLTVFYDRQRKIQRFVYFQDLTSENKTILAWSNSNGLTYTAVDSGEPSPLTNASPLTGAKVRLNRKTLWMNLEKVASSIDSEVVSFMKSKIHGKPAPE